MLYFLLLAFPATSFCQKTNDSVPVIKTDYLTKSKNQKTAGWVLLGGGTALIGIGFLVGDSKESTFDDAIGSIPLFIASGKNKRKALNMSANFKMENATNSYPAVAFKIKL